jgi:hypothetical protein
MTTLANCNIGALLTASGLALAPLATIEVRREVDGALATIYSDEAGTAPIAQPGFACDSSGRAVFYADGIDRGYQVAVTKAGGGETYTLNHVAIGTAAQRDQDDFVLSNGSAMTGFVQLTGDLTPSQITADQNDYAPTGHASASVLRLATDAQRTLTGLAGGSDGRLVTVLNSGSFNERYLSESAASTAANRFTFPNGDLILAPGEIMVLLYDVTTSRWRLFAAPVNQNSVPLPMAYLTGFRTRNGTDATNDIDVFAGECRSWDNTDNIRITSTLTKQLDAAFAAGTNAGGRDVGSIADGTWHQHAIKNPATGATDVLYSLSGEGSDTVTMTIASPCVVTYTGHGMVNGAGVIFSTTGALPTGVVAGTLYYVINRATDTFQIAATQGGAAINSSGSQSGVHTGTISPTMPSGFTKRRRIWAVLRESAALMAYTQDGDRCERNTLANENTNWATFDATARNLQCAVPTGCKVLALLQVWVSRSTGTEGAFVYRTTGQTDETPLPDSNGIGQVAICVSATGIAAGRTGQALEIMTSTEGKVRARAAVGPSAFDIRSRGWIDRRGRDGA